MEKREACSKCGHEEVEIPEIKLGTRCLERELAEEAAKGKPSFPEGMKVNCQVFKGEIGVDICLDAQEMMGRAGCRGCREPSHFCESCGEHPVRPPHDLCLACIVKEHGGGEQPPVVELKEETAVANQVMDKTEREEIEEIRTVLSTLYEGGETVMKQRSTERVPGSENSCVRGDGRPVYVKKSGLCKACYDRKYRARKTNHTMRTGEKTETSESLVARAEELVITHQNATYKFLQKRLVNDNSILADVLEKLQERGVVGPAQRGRGRKVLVEEKKAVHGSNEITGKKYLCVNGDGNTVHARGLCSTCYGRQYHEKKKRITTKPYNLESLVARAEKLVITHQNATYKFLRKHLVNDSTIIAKVLQKLEKRHVVGPKREKKSRKVLVSRTSLQKKISVRMPTRDLETLVAQAEALIRTHKDARERFLRKQLGANYKTMRKVYARLEEKGILGPPQHVKGRQILIGRKKESALRTPQPARVQPSMMGRKIGKLTDLIGVVGGNGDLANILRGVIADLQHYEEIKRVLKKIALT